MNTDNKFSDELREIELSLSNLSTYPGVPQQMKIVFKHHQLKHCYCCHIVRWLPRTRSDIETSTKRFSFLVGIIAKRETFDLYLTGNHAELSRPLQREGFPYLGVLECLYYQAKS